MEVRRVKEMLPRASIRRICRVLGVSRSGSTRPSHKRGAEGGRNKALDLSDRILELIRQHPTYGYRRLWALLRFTDGIIVTKRTVHRIITANGWQVRNRKNSARPRVQARRSQTTMTNRRWATDMTHIPCGADGWGHLVAVIDCCDRELIGFEFALRGRAREAERALENACIKRFGTLRPNRAMPVIRSDNGLVFQSRRFRETCRDYKLAQEFITPYTPEQNGIIERFFRSLKEECVWQHNFSSFEEARRTITQWIDWYNTSRPHQALGYKPPALYREQKLQQVA